MKSSFEKTVTETSPEKVVPIKDGKSGALLATYKSGIKAVIKLAKKKLPNGKRRQRGITVISHPQREVAYYRLAKLLGFEDLVPETVLTEKAVEGHTASAQLFVPAVKLRSLQPRLSDVSSSTWKSDLVDTALRVPKSQWRKLLALDIIAGARDRHANNVGVLMRVSGGKPTYQVVAWDNAVTFGKTFEKYHNVFHKLLFRRVVNFDSVWPTLDSITQQDLHKALGGLLSPEEVAHAYLRLSFFQDYPYRLPWKVCSQGHDSPHEFPSYEPYFEPFVENRPLVLALGA